MEIDGKMQQAMSTDAHDIGFMYFFALENFSH